MSAPTSSLTSRADVATAIPARYAKQLVSHLVRKIEFEAAGPVSTAVIAGVTAQAMVGEAVLTLLASADDEQAPQVAEHVLGNHTRPVRTAPRTRHRVGGQRPQQHHLTQPGHTARPPAGGYALSTVPHTLGEP